MFASHMKAEKSGGRIVAATANARHATACAAAERAKKSHNLLIIWGLGHLLINTRGIE